MSEALRIGSLFSGYGGLDSAVQEVLGGSLAWVADPAPGPSKVLAYRHPDVPNLGDITAVNWSAVEPVDIITGGSPCQDLSTAGRRVGMTEGTRSNLWVQMREAIHAIKPRYVVWENVRGALSASAASAVESEPRLLGDGPRGPALRAIGRVVGDLANLGYVGGWVGLRVADLGGCHGRFRVFLVARAADADGDLLRQHRGEPPVEEAGPVQGDRPAHSGGGRGTLALLRTPTAQLAINGGSQHPNKRKAGGHGPTLADEVEHLLSTPTTTQRGTDANLDTREGARANLHNALVDLLPTPSVADAAGGHERRGGKRGDELLLKGLAKHGHLDRFGRYAQAIASHERLAGRPAPSPTEIGPSGKPRLSPRAVEFMMCLPEGWVTDVPGLSRSEQLALLGNGVCPPQAAAALRHLLERAA